MLAASKRICPRRKEAGTIWNILLFPIEMRTLNVPDYR